MKTADDNGKRALIVVASGWSLAAYGLANDWAFLDVLPLVVTGACGLVMVIVNLIIVSAHIRREVDGESRSR